MEIGDILQYLALATGIFFMVLQVLQHKWMWYFNLLTSALSLAVTIMGQLWATSALNLYFIIMSVVGIFSWKKLAKKAVADAGDESLNEKKDVIHLVRPSALVVVLSLSISLVLCGLLGWGLSFTDDPLPYLDAVTLVLSALATWWLTRSYKEQWYVWIVGDTVATVMYCMKGLWGMAALFFFYVVSSVIGLVHWSRKGTYLN